MSELSDRLSAAALAGAYRRRRPLSPVEVTEFFLDRIDRLDGSVRSMVTVTPDLARRQAAAAARRLAAGDPGPLVGVPVVVKDLIDVAGVPTTAGSAVLADNVPSRSSQVWQRLHRAGAVLLGKANTHEFAYGGLTEPTVNPWNRGRLVGGSSGGPAAALAAGLAPLALGTDTAGSVRIPANLCGVVGLKPTNGTVSADGVVPLAPSLDVVGPMGHHVSDLDSVMRVIGGRSVSQGASASVVERASTRRLRFAVLDNPGAMSPGVQRAFDDTVAAASKLGAVASVRLDDFDRAVFVNFTLLGVEAVLVHEQWTDRRHLYSAYVRERLEQAAATTAVEYERARREAARYRSHVDRIMRDIDVLIVPGIPFAAPKLGVTTVRIGRADEDRDTAMCRNTGFANVTGHPALALPAGLEQGLPVGVQLVAHRGADADLLLIADRISRYVAVETVAPRYSN